MYTALTVESLLLVTTVPGWRRCCCSTATRATCHWRQAAYFLCRTPKVTLGNASLLILAATITAFTTEAVVVLLAPLFGLLLLHNTRPMIDQVRDEFTDHNRL